MTKEIDEKIKSSKGIIKKRIKSYNEEQILIVKNLFENRLIKSSFPHSETKNFMTQTLNLGILDRSTAEDGFLPVFRYINHRNKYYETYHGIKKEDGSYWGSVFPKIKWELIDEKLKLPFYSWGGVL